MALRAARAQKTLVEGGGWQHGKMPNKAFPLSKGHSYRLGSTWDWCVYTVSCDAKLYRILVAFDQGKAQYQAWLALVDGEDQALIARLEYHPTHNGWHCHLKSGELKDVPRGVVKMTRERLAVCRVPDVFHVSKNDAVSLAFRMFNVGDDTSGFMQ